ncbi:1,4-dihydroxy-6-naphthoate synthase [Streptomyces sp. ID05-04B]|uniref:1,4-dihydroxy-6-naphthoate synthase n=1 Tax=unclassified Streptomyces TaxID=2593676 RepID=UPI000D1A4451|nr:MULTISPECIES: 1,4-dihydroxy-6-naphthoate synthase [unclassified Streptomyces]AVV44114.1 1,4-dihydroxy-6-naphthoate synthase [Streptomyces sp. P3]MDX5570616.1 1,4-dihydroxy-6-naphthoate synthase [Streptomyces sp. ID05-04B]
MTASLTLAHSPCPNDTFVFHAWTEGLLPDAPETQLTLADIDITNGLAGRGELDVLKVSYGVLPHILDDYALLPCGGALGHGCGPLVLVAEPGDPAALVGARVAVPSTTSTAYLLFRLWAADAIPEGVGEVVVLPFHEIMPAVRDGAVDAGLVIHEARFTYGRYGLHCTADMGEEWEKRTGLPIPLGAIVARRSLGEPMLRRLTDTVRASLRAAWDNPHASRAHVLRHAQEMDPDIVDQHIGLYVNEFTAALGEDGLHAVRTLLDGSAELGLLPGVAASALDMTIRL